MKQTGLPFQALALLAILAICEPAWAATISATSCSHADVQSAVNAASNGDTVRIPAGTCTWSAGINTSKGIHVQGAGAGRVVGRSVSAVSIGSGSKVFATQSGLALSPGQTVRVINTYNGNNFILGTVSSYSGSTLTVSAASWGGSGTHNIWVIATQPSTVITANGGTLFSVTENTTHSFELSGIKLVRGTAGTGGSFVTLSYAQNGRPAKIHDCWMSANTSFKMILVATRRGLVYRCSFDAGFTSAFPVANVNAQAIGLKWEGGGATWATPSTMGAADSTGSSNFYAEDNDFHGFPFQSFDMDDNSRTVIRHNVFNNSALVAHGQDTSNHGVRHFEIYNNEFIYNANNDSRDFNLSNGWFYVRGGTGVWADNIVGDIRSGWWGGNPSEMVLIVQHIRRDAGSPSCWTGGPPAPRQVGYGFVTGAGKTGAGGYQGDLEPFYLWSNSGTLVVDLENYNPDECGNGQQTSSYIRSGTEYRIGTAKPGYAKFTYPHPLRGGDAPGPGALPAPANLRLM